MNEKFYTLLNEKVMKQLEKGIIPWQKEWNSISYNIISKKNYSPLNQMLLETPGGYMSWNQLKAQGKSLVKGCHGEQVFFTACETLYRIGNEFFTAFQLSKKNIDIADIKKEDRKEFWCNKVYTVFSERNFTDYKEPEITEEITQELENAEKCINDYIAREKVTVINSKKAQNSDITNSIKIASKSDFENLSSYYRTFFHEIIHNTAQAVGRDKSKYHQSRTARAREELVAEIGANILCNRFRLKPDYENSASYIANWAEFIKDEKDFFYRAYKDAEKSAKYVLQENF